MKTGAQARGGGVMNTVYQYQCSGCLRTTDHLFGKGYKPWRFWSHTCWKCGRYHLQRLVRILNPDQSQNGPVWR